MTDTKQIVHGKKLGMGEAYLGSTRTAVTKIVLADGDSLAVGTVLSIQGVSKGKGFAGVVKRWGFAGGPKTHGQSDRLRAPGSIGQGTTPGRVRKNKKMAGRMGTDTKTVKNSLVLGQVGNILWVTGPVPGTKNTALRLTVTDQKELEGVVLPGVVQVEPAPVEEQPAVEEVATESN